MKNGMIIIDADGHRLAPLGHRTVFVAEVVRQFGVGHQVKPHQLHVGAPIYIPRLTMQQRDQDARTLHGEARPNADRRDGGDRALC